MGEKVGQDRSRAFQIDTRCEVSRSPYVWSFGHQAHHFFARGWDGCAHSGAYTDLFDLLLRRVCGGFYEEVPIYFRWCLCCGFDLFGLELF